MDGIGKAIKILNMKVSPYQKQELIKQEIKKDSNFLRLIPVEMNKLLAPIDTGELHFTPYFQKPIKKDDYYL